MRDDADVDAGDREAAAEKAGIAACVFGSAALATVLVANAGVLARYVFQISLPSVDEILRFLFIWLFFVGSALSFREGGLISITMIEDCLKTPCPMLFGAVKKFQNLTILLFAAVSAYTGWNMLATQFEFEELAVVLEINMGWVTLGVVIGYALMTYYALANLLRGHFNPWEFVKRKFL